MAVVGAGPAGAWAAYQLARAGARVALIDGSHPREKPCGGGLSARTLALLGDSSAAVACSAVDISSARFSASSESAAVSLRSCSPPLRNSRSADSCSRPVDHTPALLVASRRDFDAALLQTAVGAGADHLPHRVAALHRANAAWVLTTGDTAVTAEWVIGADGANSLVRRRVLGAFARGELSIASGFYVSGCTATRIDIEFMQSPQGYLWSFPRPDHLAVGVCAQADRTSSRQLLDAARVWIRAHTAAPDAALTRYSWPIPSLSDRTLARQRPAGERWLLVGDAAGLVDSITREGIFFALQSAELAAASLERANPAQAYVAALGTSIQRELRKAARMKDQFFASPFCALLMRALRRSDYIAMIMADLISGRQTYEGLRRRLLMTGEWPLALEYLKLSMAMARMPGVPKMP